MVVFTVCAKASKNQAYFMKTSLLTLLPLSILAFIAPQLHAVTVINSLPHVIRQPGVYVLESNLTFTQTTIGVYAISINASDVVLNFQGHSISNLVTATESSGVVAQQSSNVTVENGTLNGFYFGVVLGGNNPKLIFNNVCQNMKLNNSFTVSVFLTYNVNAIVRNCQITNQGKGPDGTVLYTGGAAIEDEFGQGVRIENNTISGSAGIGIYATGGSYLIQNNFVTSCGTVGIQGVTNAKALNNVVTDCPQSYLGVSLLGNTNF
jgi:parallel beta-helix repeat protein